MYIKVINGIAESYSLQQLVNENRNTSFPSVIPPHVLARYNVYPVFEGIKPEFNPDTHKIIKGEITGSGTTWTQQYIVVELTQAELDAKDNDRKQSIERERDRRVAELVNTKGGSRTYLLMQAVGLLHAKGNRPLNPQEQGRESELLTSMSAIESIYTAADDAIANNTPLDQIVW